MATSLIGRLTMCWQNRLSFLVWFFALVMVSPAAHGAFNQCPRIGYATGCSFLITIQPDLRLTIAPDPGVLPFDNIEDTLVGVQNNSGATVFGVFLSGSDIFGFDGDGAGDPTGSFWGPGSPFGPFPGGPFGPTGYEGPNTSFTVRDFSNGVVNFFHRNSSGMVVPGLPPGQSLWFSLEGAPSSIGFRKFVAVDPGHGLHCDQPGSPPDGARDQSGIDSEDNFALDIANTVSALLSSLGHRVLQTRTSQCFVSLPERTRLANETGTDVFVSIHLNASPRRTAHGTEVLIKTRSRPDLLRLGQLLLQQQLGLGLSQFSTGIEERPGLWVLRKTDMSSALSEVAFISNSMLAAGQTVTDEQLLDDVRFRAQAANAIFNGINQFLNP